ncbi:MAG: galactokinase [Bacteroidota bacterium]
MTSIRTQAPGRINIIGEHTDYNDGFVLPAAIDKGTVVQLKKNGTASKCSMIALNIGEVGYFDLDNLKPVQHGWQNYLLGIVAELQKLGAKLTGFDCEFGGNVPIGSGMSSSASIECSFAFALNELFDLGFDKWQLIKAAQAAEHNFVGIKCGIMDMFASVMGKKNQVMLLDCRSLEFDYFPLDLGDYQLLLLNTNVSHSLTSSAYNDRRTACEKGVELLQETYPKIKSLRDVSLQQLSDVMGQLPPNIFKRCYHVVAENERVLAATEALKQQDFTQLGELIYQSHFSLQNDYEVSCPELDFLVQLTLDKNYVLGSRMMGGGFGGCTISIIQKDMVGIFKTHAAKAYKERFDKDLTPYTVSIEDGAKVLS